MTDDNNDEYQVGYAKPPKNTQFQPGKSGNPKGRPKGAKGIATVFMEEANQKVSIKIGDKTVKITKLQATVKRLFQQALEGKPHAIARITEMARVIEPQMEQKPDQALSADDQNILREYVKRQMQDGVDG